MQYFFNNLLNCEIKNVGQYLEMLKDYEEVTNLIIEHVKLESINYQSDDAVEIAYQIMKKEFELKDKYGLPLHYHISLEWFRASFENIMQKIKKQFEEQDE